MYLGCRFHPCFNCDQFRRNEASGLLYDGLSAKDAHRVYNERMEAIKLNYDGVKKVSLWHACEFKKVMQCDQKFLNSKWNKYKYFSRLSIREACTSMGKEVFQLSFNKARNTGFKMFFLDLNSCFAHCLEKFKYPVGKYSIFLLDDILSVTKWQNGQIVALDGSEVFGFVKVIALPVRKSSAKYHFPYFQCNIGSKKNPLKISTYCLKCAKTSKTNPCYCSDDLRSFDVTTTFQSLNAQ